MPQRLRFQRGGHFSRLWPGVYALAPSTWAIPELPKPCFARPNPVVQPPWHAKAPLMRGAAADQVAAGRRRLSPPARPPAPQCPRTAPARAYHQLCLVYSSRSNCCRPTRQQALPDARPPAHGPCPVRQTPLHDPTAPAATAPHCDAAAHEAK